jgi:hypothetical protein
MEEKLVGVAAAVESKQGIAGQMSIPEKTERQGDADWQNFRGQ